MNLVKELFAFFYRSRTLQEFCNQCCLSA